MAWNADNLKKEREKVGEDNLEREREREMENGEPTKQHCFRINETVCFGWCVQAILLKGLYKEFSYSK